MRIELRLGSFFWAALLIGFGAVLLFNNLGLTEIDLLTFVKQWWPVIFIYWGLQVLTHWNRHSLIPLVASVLLVALGATLLAHNYGYPWFGQFWSLAWPLLLVGIGLYLALGSRRRRRWRVRGGRRGRMSLIGDVALGGSFDLKDSHLQFGVGDVNVDLTKARIPDGETELQISGSIGDVDVLVPPDLAVAAEAHLGVGEIQLLHERRKGFGGSLKAQTADFDSAPRRVRIRINLGVGDINVARLG